MLFRLECQKIKRTGFIPALLGGGILAGAVPLLNMALRARQYQELPGSPVEILLDANWQMMAMLNLLLVTAGACLLYNTEYAGGALQKMSTLPVTAHGIFLGKALLLAVGCLTMLVIEEAACAFCCLRWFPAIPGLAPELFQSFGLALLMLLPAALTALLIASLWENMWISLGVCVLGIFVASMVPAGGSVLSLFPFALAFSIPSQAATQGGPGFAALAECLLLLAAEFLILKIRRSLS